MTLQLVVTKSFLKYVRGDIIADAQKVRDLLTTDYRRFVTRITQPTASKG